jgi:hypothetical protein
VGSFVVTWVTSPLATWSTLGFLLVLHLLLNRAAVRSVKLRTLNRQRATIVFEHLIRTGEVLDPEEVSRKEHIFADGNKIWSIVSGKRVVVGRCKIGASISDLAYAFAGASKPQSEDTSISILGLLRVFQDEKYILFSSSHKKSLSIALKEGSDPRTQLKAWFQVCLIMMDQKKDIRDTLDELNLRWFEAIGLLKQKGWDLDTGALETGTKLRLEIDEKND